MVRCEWITGRVLATNCKFEMRIMPDTLENKNREEDHPNNFEELSTETAKFHV